jgi:DNA-binding MarR family transcriptional regulator
MPRKSACPASPVAQSPVCFYSAHNYRPEDSVGYMMRNILTALARGVERDLVHTELTNAQWVPLFKIYTGRANTPAELARECQLDAGAMTRMLDRLESKGLCRRVRSEADRRVVHIELTEAGNNAASVIPSVLSGVQNAHLAGFSPDEFETLKHFLRRILDNARSAAAHDPAPESGETDA